MDGFFDFIELRTEEKLLSDIRLLGLDIETTGLDVLSNEIIEIGIAEYDTANHTITTRYQSLVKPNQQVKDHIIRITGIDNKMLVDAPKIEDISEDLLKVIKGSLLIIHKTDFDIPFLQKFISPNLLETYDIAVFDRGLFTSKIL